MKRYESYQAGILDGCRRLGIDAPDGMNEGDFDYPDEDKNELVLIEYLRGQISAILDYLRDKADGDAKLANDLSCHLNGIIPD